MYLVHFENVLNSAAKTVKELTSFLHRSCLAQRLNRVETSDRYSVHKLIQIHFVIHSQIVYPCIFNSFCHLTNKKNVGVEIKTEDN